MTDLAMHAGQGPIQSADVAVRMVIPPVYLDQVLSTLRKTGLVRSTRGPRGGHELSRAPEAITMAEIVRALDGPFEILDCLDDPTACDLTNVCPQRPVWRSVREALEDALSNVRLSDLSADMQEARERPVYSI